MKHIGPAALTNPMIGTISHMLKSTQPFIMLPHGMVRTAPVTVGSSDAYCGQLQGFPAGDALIAIDDGAQIDHAREEIRCYHGKWELEPDNACVEATVTAHAHVYRIAGAKHIRLRFGMGEAREEDGVVLIKMPFKSPSGVIGTEYIAVRLDGAGEAVREGAKLVYAEPGAIVECRAAVSYISFEKAIQSLALECDGRSFDALAGAAQDEWNALLGKVKVSGNTQDRQIAFYTALYRAFERMTDYGEHGEYFGYDGEVHEGSFYTNDGLWDTFRCMHPLQLLLNPSRQKEIVESYNTMYKQSGLMPSFPQFGADAPIMLGFHAAALFADSYAKGLDLDYETAYQGIRKNALEQSMLPWVSDLASTELDKCYYDKGFFPALAKGEVESEPGAHAFERRQAISVTLEHAYDDWCAAQLAKALGHGEDYDLFMARAMNYQNLYNAQIGAMAPKSIDSNWVDGFDPTLGGGLGGRDYTAENNTWVYTWSVFHDVDGLADLMGGKAAAEARLDELFSMGVGSKYGFLGQFPDSTGLMGRFTMGNEPAFHIPYLFSHLGAAWKSQKRIRELMDIWFTNSPTGICGDEDGGAMSSWFVFSAMGFYPVCPGKAEYTLGTPLFDRVDIELENGNVFSVVSDGAGDGLRYIERAELNGVALSAPFITHEDIMKGGELRLTMGKRPVMA